MPTLAEIRTQYPQYEDMSDEALAGALYKKFYSDMDRAEFNKKIGATTAAQPEQPRGFFRRADDFVRGLADTMTFGFADEIAAGAGSLTGIGGERGDYAGNVEEQRARDATGGAERLGGQIVGALTGGIGAAKAGATLAGRTGASTLGRAVGGAAEGAAYGAGYGAGSSKEGERGRGAAEGAAIGAITGGIVSGVGGAIANRGARIAASKAAPTVQQLGDDANNLYAAMRAENVNINQGAAQRLAATVRNVAGNPNARLRPNTVGILREVDQAAKKPMTLEAFDELRQGVNDALKSAKPGDSRVLMKIKTTMDDFARTMKPGDFTGDANKAVGFLEKARDIYSRKSKTELIEDILDKADVKSAQFSQSGMANAVRTVMRGVYLRKSTLRMFSKEEQALIRQMAKGGSGNSVINLLAKFAPRGPVSAAISTMLGNATMGPAGYVIGPAIGQAAAKSADSAAIKALDILRTSAATGGAARVAPQLPSRTSNVLIPAAAELPQAIRP